MRAKDLLLYLVCLMIVIALLPLLIEAIKFFVLVGFVLFGATVLYIIIWFVIGFIRG